MIKNYRILAGGSNFSGILLLQNRVSTSLLHSQASKLDPFFITGFTDGEGCFSVSISNNQDRKVGYSVKIFCQIGLHQKDLNVLEKIQSFFGVGNIYIKKDNSAYFLVQSIQDLEIIIKHFDNYPLISNKFADYQLFKQVFELVKDKQHLTKEGLSKIVAIKASMNLGLSDKLKSAFPNIIPVDRPVVVDQVIQDPNWIAGFTSGEGCFYIRLAKSKSHLTGYQVLLIFYLTQHHKDGELMKNIVSYFECGRYSLRKNKLAGDFEVTKFSDITHKIIPFFSKYSIEGVKYQDFLDFCFVAELIKNKAHLSNEGIEEIRKIKSRMNRTRSILELGGKLE
jgi:hypothetical protein